MDSDSFRKESGNLFGLHTWYDHAGASRLPISWSCYFFLSGQLEGINHSQNLIKVSACGGRVQNGQLEPPKKNIQFHVKNLKAHILTGKSISRQLLQFDEILH